MSRTRRRKRPLKPGQHQLPLELSARTVTYCDTVELEQPSGTCTNCHQRPATAWWSPEGVLGFVHGNRAAWCRVCVVETQLQHAREQAARIPELEAQLQQLRVDYGNANDGGGSEPGAAGGRVQRT